MNNFLPFALGLSTALGLGLAVHTANNFNQQDKCYEARKAYILEGTQKHTLVQHRTFFGETYACLPTNELS
jgi:hypothetical protein